MGRQKRVAEAIKKEVSCILHDEMKDPRLGFVTITQVQVSPDLGFAKVFFSVLGKEEDRKKTKEALDSARGFIRKLVSERINLRLSPELSFKEDISTEYSVHIQKVLEEIKRLNEPIHPSKGLNNDKQKKEGSGELEKND
jgi:ribosome-binding factor A